MECVRDAGMRPLLEDVAVGGVGGALGRLQLLLATKEADAALAPVKTWIKANFSILEPLYLNNLPMGKN